MSSNGKKRAPNFNPKEELLLVELARKYKKTLECKLTDSKTHHEKAEIWTNIETEFNNAGETYRPKDVLKKKYENIKKRVKKKYADEKCYARGTGGGPPQKLVFTDVDDTIKEILGTRVEGLTSEFDDDSADRPDSMAKDNAGICEDYVLNDLSSVPQRNSKEFEEITVIVNDNDEPSDYLSNDESRAVGRNWSKYTPKMLKTPKARALQASSSNRIKANKGTSSSVTDRVSQWVEAKSLLEQSRMKFLEEEHKVRLQLMQEKHDQEMTLMKKKAELEMKLMEDESKIRQEFSKKQKVK